MRERIDALPITWRSVNSRRPRESIGSAVRFPRKLESCERSSRFPRGFLPARQMDLLISRADESRAKLSAISARNSRCDLRMVIPPLIKSAFLCPTHSVGTTEENAERSVVGEGEGEIIIRSGSRLRNFGLGEIRLHL